MLDKLLKRWGKLSKKPAFGRVYMVVALVVLFLTTLFWAVKGANLQLYNADQLIDPYLFQNWHVFHYALFPAVHTFLIKWPLFLLIRAFGYSAAAFTSATVLAVLITVAALAYVMYRIERRPLVFGTLCLALASVLLLIPAQPYPGALLPVNMAMLASRNLEYVLFIVAAVLFVRSPKLKNWNTFFSVVCLSLLVATDRLFLTLALGGAVLGLLAYALVRSWQLVSLFARWLVVGLVSGLGGSLILWLLHLHNFTRFAGQASSGGPYNLSLGPHNVILGSLYGVMGLATNLGANPAFAATEVKRIPAEFFNHLLSFGLIGYLVNIILLLVAAYAIWRLSGYVLLHHKRQGGHLANAYKLSAILIWSTLAAILAFVFTNHYYAVDARYLGLILFTAFISLATFSRQKNWQPQALATAGVAILVGTLLGLPASSGTARTEKAALANMNLRDSLVASAVNQHRASPLLVGDYWRVLPAKQSTKGQLSVLPLDNCTTPRQGLTSQAWNLDLKKNGFAYLLSSDRPLTNYPLCSLKQIVAAYGRPNASVVTSGTFNQPKDTVLFYDKGINKSSAVKAAAATVTPIAPEDLPYTACQGPTIMNIVAHQDDDLLFMNPDLTHNIKAGHCVRTVYVTAGDAGAGSFYWLGREQGSEAAYSYMTGSHDIWVQRIVKLANDRYAIMSKPRDNPNISLIFLRLPDGNTKGQGFGGEGYESLAKLEAGKIKSMHTVDGQSVYSSQNLTDTLETFMHVYQPTEIRTQSDYAGAQYTDHSDHMAVSRYVKQAYAEYENRQYENLVTIPLKFYIGYPVHGLPVNVTGGDLAAKQAAFMAYSQHDSGVCAVLSLCNNSAYSAYLQREYQNPF